MHFRAAREMWTPTPPPMPPVRRDSTLRDDLNRQRTRLLIDLERIDAALRELARHG